MLDWPVWSVRLAAADSMKRARERELDVEGIPPEQWEALMAAADAEEAAETAADETVADEPGESDA